MRSPGLTKLSGSIFGGLSKGGSSFLGSKLGYGGKGYNVAPTSMGFSAPMFSGTSVAGLGNGISKGYGRHGYGSLGYGSKGTPSMSYGSKGLGSLGYGSKGLGSLGYGSKGLGSLGYGSKSLGSLGYGSKGLGSLGYGSTGLGSLGYGSKGFGRPLSAASLCSLAT